MDTMPATPRANVDRRTPRRRQLTNRGVPSLRMVQHSNKPDTGHLSHVSKAFRNLHGAANLQFSPLMQCDQRGNIDRDFLGIFYVAVA